MMVRVVAKVLTLLTLIVMTGCASNRNQPVAYDYASLPLSWQQELVNAEGVDDEYIDYREELETQLFARQNPGSTVRVPPGMAAHVGYLYLKRGDRGTARKFFELEKQLFPESAVAMNAFLKKS